MRTVQFYTSTVTCDTINIHMQRQTTGKPYLLRDKQCIFGAFATTKPVWYYFHLVWLQFSIMPRCHRCQLVINITSTQTRHFVMGCPCKKTSSGGWGRQTRNKLVWMVLNGEWHVKTNISILLGWLQSRKE